MKDENTPVYMISVVAKLVGVHPQTLRFYESEGLLKPSRTAGKTRLYSEADLKKAKRIVSLTRDRGVNIAGVEVILSMEDELYEIFELLAGIMSQQEKALFAEGLRRLGLAEINVEKLIQILQEEG